MYFSYVKDVNHGGQKVDDSKGHFFGLHSLCHVVSCLLWQKDFADVIKVITGGLKT